LRFAVATRRVGVARDHGDVADERFDASEVFPDARRLVRPEDQLAEDHARNESRPGTREASACRLLAGEEGDDDVRVEELTTHPDRPARSPLPRPRGSPWRPPARSRRSA